MFYFLVAATLLGAAYAQNYPSLPTVDLGYQVYRASGFNDSGNFYNFSNIRYAAPPVGNLRFALPQPPAKNRSYINNGDMSRICPQANPPWTNVSTEAVMRRALGLPILNTTYAPEGANTSSPVPEPSHQESEDCLFLDVFVPRNIFETTRKRPRAPVLVWIHGGGYIIGHKNTNPAGLLATSTRLTHGDIIYVSINYRLGALGWMGGPSYQAEGGISNLGLYDQQLALKWIQQNIHLFGGDKNRVTVFGESAGGGSIIHQITAYGGTKGSALFQQALPQSPGWLPISSAATQEDTYRKFLSLTNTTSVSELRTLSSKELVRANAQQVIYDSAYGTFTYGPVVDGLIVPLQPSQLLAQGRFDKNVRVMVGHNADEGALFTPFTVSSAAEVEDRVKVQFPYAPQSSINYILDTLYPPIFDGSKGYTNNFERASLIVAESGFTCNTYYLSKAYRNDSYSYLFAVPPAIHAQDVPYTFYDGGATSGGLTGVENVTIAIALQELITSFVNTGVPKATGVKQFNIYGADANVLELGVTGIREVRDSNVNTRCDWWQKALYY